MNTFTKPFLVSIILLLSLGILGVKAQVVYEPEYHTVYGYLSRLAQKGVIDLNDVVMPLPRTYINSKLDSLSHHKDLLTPLEREELTFYLKEYTLERNLAENKEYAKPVLGLFSTKKDDRTRVTVYQDKDFTFSGQPIVGFRYENVSGSTLGQRWVGAWIYGYIGKNIGYSVDFVNSKVDNIFSGYDYKRTFSPEPGRFGDLVSKSKYDYNDFNATITAKWKWGVLTFGKNPIQIGYGAGGKIILSNKAPSFPQVRLDVNPVKWLSFNYAHIWLNSNVIDSTTFYPTSVPGRLQYQFREKYLAVHSLTYKPFKGMSLTLGESAVYNDRIKIGYLIPTVLFSAMSHYLGEVNAGNNNSTINNTISNSQVFVQLSSRNHIPKTHLYFSYFIDELTLRTGNTALSNARNHTAYQIGASVADFLFNNLHLTLEYSKIQPFAYVHFIPAQTYQSNNFNLGHWIGSNADQLFAQLHYRVIRGMDFKVSYNYVRKGTVGTGVQQASAQDIYPFLWGNVNKYSYFQTSIQYEPIHDFFVRINYKIENQSGITSVNNNYFSTSLMFGL
ncbi:capsule assembly Wzi family protein [Arcicella rigui]|uniref:Capsule assembly Wzi family protein n=1 Tax=Arcicella rigui TaxID=797020 RepID=A0ABU5Q8X8_9BACT|nr:hypothetical protein [Arcicella rigui]MEA5139295.1 capsule assembly Wzi family protein [Arcicella rigui]